MSDSELSEYSYDTQQICDKYCGDGDEGERHAEFEDAMRQRKAARKPRTVYTEDEKDEIKYLLHIGTKKADIGRRFKMSNPTVSCKVRQEELDAMTEDEVKELVKRMKPIVEAKQRDEQAEKAAHARQKRLKWLFKQYDRNKESIARHKARKREEDLLWHKAHPNIHPHPDAPPKRDGPFA